MVRRFPRISVNKLAEYIVASPRRQRRILMDAMAPRDYVVQHHRRARSAILWASRRGGVDEVALSRSIERLQALVPKSERDELDILSSIAAIEAFGEIKDKLNFGESIRRPRTRSAIMVIEGVAISVLPNLIVRGGTPEAPTVGAIKLYLVKTNPLNKKGAEYATTILRAFLEERLSDSSFHVDPQLCQVADVFAGRVHLAPKAYKNRMKDVAAACDSIRRLWNTYMTDFEQPYDDEQPFQFH